MYVYIYACSLRSDLPCLLWKEKLSYLYGFDKESLYLCSFPTLIFSIQEEWPEGYKLAMQMNFNFPDCSGTPLKELIPLASNDGINVIGSLIHWCPNKRPKADQVKWLLFDVRHRLMHFVVFSLPVFLALLFPFLCPKEGDLIVKLPLACSASVILISEPDNPCNVPPRNVNLFAPKTSCRDTTSPQNPALPPPPLRTTSPRNRKTWVPRSAIVVELSSCWPAIFLTADISRFLNVTWRMPKHVL